MSIPDTTLYRRYDPEAEDVYPAGMVDAVLARLQRFEDTVIALAALADYYAARVSPHYPLALSYRDFPLEEGDLDGLWFGSWEATAEARKDDPRYRGDGVR